MSASENRDSVPPIAEQCVSVVNECLEGLPDEERINNGNLFIETYMMTRSLIC